MSQELQEPQGKLLVDPKLRTSLARIVRGLKKQRAALRRLEKKTSGVADGQVALEEKVNSEVKAMKSRMTKLENKLKGESGAGAD